MELVEIPAAYLAMAVVGWVLAYFWLVRHPEWIAASVLALFFFMPAALDFALGGKHIPTGQIVILFFLPPLMHSLLARPTTVGWPTVFLLFAYLACIGASILVNGLSFWEHKAALVPPLFALIVYLSVQSRHALYRLLVVYALLILVNTVFAALQRAGFEWAYPPSARLVASAGGWVRGVGLSGHFAMTGLYAGVTVPVALSVLLNIRSRSARLLSFLLLLVGIAGVALTVLRAAMLGAVIGVCVVLCMKRNFRAVIASSSIIAAAMVVLLAVPQSRHAMIDMVGHASASDESSAARPRLARMGLSAWQLAPWLGGGPGAVGRSVRRDADPHNTFVNVLAETGAVGALLFSAIYLRAFWVAARVGASGLGPESAALAGALSTTIPVAIFHSLNYIVLFWFVPALCLALARIQKVGLRDGLVPRLRNSRARPKPLVNRESQRV